MGTKISALSAAAALDGTEVLPIVQAGATVKATVQNTANRVTDLTNVTNGSLANTGLAHSSMTIAGHAVSLGGTQALAAADLSNGVTGSGSVVLATSPTLVTPALGTPASGNLSNCTGLSVTLISEVTTSASQ